MRLGARAPQLGPQRYPRQYHCRTFLNTDITPPPTELRTQSATPLAVRTLDNLRRRSKDQRP